MWTSSLIFLWECHQISILYSLKQAKWTFSLFIHKRQITWTISEHMESLELRVIVFRVSRLGTSSPWASCVLGNGVNKSIDCLPSDDLFKDVVEQTASPSGVKRRFPLTCNWLVHQNLTRAGNKMKVVYSGAENRQVQFLFSHLVVLTLCNPMDCSTPDFPVLHYLLQFAQTHVHWVGDAI